MANRRMLSKSIIETDLFLDMPAESQALYMHLVLNADDDGFVDNPGSIRRMTGFSNDSLKLLIAKGFLIPFHDSVVVVTHWYTQNKVQPSRKNATIHSEEKSLLSVDENGKYILCQQNVDKLPTNCRQITDKLSTQVRLGKDRLGKDRLGKDSIYCSEFQEPSEPKAQCSGIKMILNDKSYYDVPMDKITLWKDCYPGIDVERELRKMAAWCDSNPQKRKTKRGIARFITNWLSKEQDRGGKIYAAEEKKPEYHQVDYYNGRIREPSPDDAFK